MRQSDRVKLLFGPYHPPRYRIGQVVQCEARGEVVIVETSTGRIPWPFCKQGRGSKSLVLYEGLLRAIEQESGKAVCHWWGVGINSVTKWRKLLRVPLSNAGTHRLRAEYALDPQRRKNIAASKRGKKRPAYVVAGMRARMLGKRPSEASRRKMSEAHRLRGTRPPWLKPAWTAKEDAFVRTLPAAEAAARTRRSLSAVYSRRSELGINNGRTTRHKPEGRL
jgi:hypothetical protein